MADKPKIGATLALDGEKEFKQAITEVNRTLAVNRSEMALTTAEYGENEKSTESLTAKKKILKEQIEAQTQKINIMEKALENAKKEYGENDKRTLDWQKSLNYANADLAGMNRNLEDNEKALKKAESGTKSLGDVVRGLAGAVGIDIPPALQGMTEKLDKVNASAATLVGVLGGIAAGLSKLTLDTSKTADEILTLSSTSGMTTDKIQELKYSAELLDVSFETIDGATTKLIKSMDSAKSKTGEQYEAFKKLRISAVDPLTGNLRDSNEVFYDVIDALGGVKNETERDALSMALLGKSARELNPLIEQGSEKMNALAKEAHDMGYVMDEETLAAFGDLDDASQRMNNQMDSLKNSIALTLLPILTGLFEAIGKIPVPVLQMIITLAGVVTAILLIVKTISELKTGVGGAISFFKNFDVQTLKTTAIIMGIVAAIIILVVAIATLLGKAKDLQSNLDSVGQTMSGLQGQVYSTQNATQRIPMHAKGTSYHPGGLAIVGEEGPELVDLPRGTKVYPHGTGPSGGDTYYITIDAKNVKEFNDVVDAAKRAKQTRRAK